ncbi:hypothetical protein [Comamonas piscis]
MGKIHQRRHVHFCWREVEVSQSQTAQMWANGVAWPMMAVLPKRARRQA